MIEFDGEWITKDEFDTILGGDKCCNCHKPFRLVDGHKYLNGNVNHIICVDCLEKHESANEEMKVKLRQLNKERMEEKKSSPSKADSFPW